jgi:acyl-CoA dehydrogenase family protein 9
MRAFIALSAMKPVGERLSGLGEIGLGDPIGSIGLLVDYAAGRVRREVRPERIGLAHPELERHANAVADQVKDLAGATESLIREQNNDEMMRQLHQKPHTPAIADVNAQVAVISRVSSIFAETGVEPSGQERYIADTFCARAADRVRGRLRQIEENDDERITAIAKLAYKRGEYGYALFED